MQVPMNVARFLGRARQLYGNKQAIFDGEQVFTYGQMWERVQRLSHALKDLGVGLGDRVAWLGYNNYPLLEAYFGVVQFGAILVPLNIRLTPDDLKAIIADAGPKVLVFDSDFEAIARELQQGRPLQLIEIQLQEAHQGYVGYEDFLRGASSSADAADRELNENAVAELFYTSGTTGRPKGVALTHRNLYMNAMNVMATESLSDETVMLHTIPLFHVNGWGAPHYTTALGATHVMLRKFVPRTVFSLVERYQVTHALMVPTMIRALNLSPEKKDFHLESLTRVIIGGAPSPSSFVSETMEALHAEYQGGYGLSETSPVVSSAAIKGTLQGQPAQSLYAWRGTAGIPLVGVEVSLVDGHDRELEWDGESVGELRVRADTVMAGYWNHPDETAQVLKNGWLYTGDMAIIDPEGYIRIVDRKKDIIISGGENIATVELEDALYHHPAVAEACVIGKPDAIWGEVPMAVVSLKPGMTVDPETILADTNARLASFKRLKDIRIVSELPKTGTGKIQKARVRMEYGGSPPL